MDYRSNPLPNERLDCETVSALLQEIPLSTVRECLASIQEPVSVSYRLRRVAVPYLELDEPETAPVCLARALPRIPVPREIVFQARAARVAQSAPGGSAPLDCYSSRLDLEADEVLGSKLPMARVALRFELPLENSPATDAELSRTLAAWALTPFWNPQEQAIPSKLMPDRLCRVCLGEKQMKESPYDPQHWPDPGP